MSAEKGSTAENPGAEDQPARATEHFLPADIADINKLHHELAVHQAELELQNEELRHTQLSLQRARDLHVELYEHAPVGYVLLDASGIIRRTNATWRAMLQRPDEDFCGTPFAETLLEGDDRVFLSRFRSLFHNPADKQIELRIKRHNTKPFHAHITAKRSVGERGENDTSELMVMVSDITERKQAEEARRESEERFKALHNASFGGIAIHDQGVILDCNQGLSEISGFCLDELMGMDGLLLIAEQSREAVMNNIRSGYEKPYEAFGLRRNGEEYPLRLEARSIPYHGKMVRVVEFRDITERKRAEEAVRSLLSRLQLLAEHLPGFVYQYQLMADGTSAFPYAGPGIEAIYGLSSEDAARDAGRVFAVLHPDDLARVGASIQHSADTLTLWHDIYRVLHPDGRLLWVDGRATPIRQPDGSTLWHGYIHDITERKEAEARLSESETKHRQLIENTHDIIYSLTPEGLFSYVSPAWTILLGHPVTEIEGHLFTEFIHPDDHPACFAFLQKVLTGQRQEGVEYRVQHISGEWRWHTSSATPAKNTDGLVTGYEGIGRDITERKQAQWALEQKNEELGQFVYIVSHDLKSPLVTVKSFAGMLRQDLLKADKQQIDKDLDYIDKAADKMQQLLDALLQYSRIGRVDTIAQTLSSGQTIENCLTTLAGILQQHQVQTPTSELTQQLQGDPRHFEHIWQNLIENAVKYSGDQAHPQIEIGAMQQAQDVVFYVRDNGIGIAPEHNERIFNLFSQLNPGSEGSGLGLALVKKIVSIYQGRIWVESAGEGKGSCFMFTLPGAVVKRDRAR
jgi:PAS domain S-box-containing protein